MLPMILRLKVIREEGRGINLFIPLILVYLLLLPFFVIAIPLGWWWYNRAMEREGNEKRKASVRMIPSLFALFSAMSGTEVEVSNKQSEIILKLL
jgi:LytS/YehU family sensor histidine kinase